MHSNQVALKQIAVSGAYWRITVSSDRLPISVRAAMTSVDEATLRVALKAREAFFDCFWQQPIVRI
jgi:hypothetical protein